MIITVTKEGDSTRPEVSLTPSCLLPHNQQSCFWEASQFPYGVYHCHPTVLSGSSSAPRHVLSASLQFSEDQEPPLPSSRLKTYSTDTALKLFQPSLSLLVRKEKSTLTPAQRIAFIKASTDL